MTYGRSHKSELYFIAGRRFLDCVHTAGRGSIQQGSRVASPWWGDVPSFGAGAGRNGETGGRRHEEGRAQKLMNAPGDLSAIRSQRVAGGAASHPWRAGPAPW